MPKLERTPNGEIRIWALVACFGLVALSVSASSPESSGIEFFEKHVRPVLVENCYKCHSAEAEKLKGGLHLDSKEGVLKGGDTGPAIVPGQPDKSLLIKAVRYADENLQMPPKGKKLTAEQIADLAEFAVGPVADRLFHLAETGRAEDQSESGSGQAHPDTQGDVRSCRPSTIAAGGG